MGTNMGAKLDQILELVKKVDNMVEDNRGAVNDANLAFCISTYGGARGAILAPTFGRSKIKTYYNTGSSTNNEATLYKYGAKNKVDTALLSSKTHGQLMTYFSDANAVLISQTTLSKLVSGEIIDVSNYNYIYFAIPNGKGDSAYISIVLEYV